MLRPTFPPACLYFLSLVLLAGPLLTSAARSEPGQELQEILTRCDQAPDSICEQQLWSFTDISGDNLLGKAEIARFFRLVTALKAPDIQQQKNASEVLAFVGAPWIAQSVLDNFDYDGSGFLTRGELLHETDPAGLKAFAARILQTGEDAFMLGSAMTGSSMGGQMARPQRRSPTSNPVKPAPRIVPRTVTKSVVPSPKPDISDPLTKAELNSISQKIDSCWQFPAMSMDGEDMRVRLKLDLKPDGSVQGPVSVVDTGDRASRDKFFKVAADAARRAVTNCAPYTSLPAAKYKHWQKLEITLRRKTLLGG
jgi:hypothetical protein